MKNPILTVAGLAVTLALAFVAWKQMPGAATFNHQEDKALKKDSSPLPLKFTRASSKELLGLARDKAGLAWDGWKSPTARILGYSATIIREKAFTADGHK